MGTLLLVCVTAFIAAGLNALAGGGTFILFPALTGAARLSEKAANIACTVGLWPGTATAVAAARREIARLPRGMVIAYSIISLLGGFLGAELLLHTSEITFKYAIPWLLAFATTVFALGDRISKWAKREAAHLAGKGHSKGWTIFVGGIQFILSIYGGYFGAGMSILTLAGLSLVGLPDIRQMNSMKMVLAAAANFTAGVVFLFGPVAWHYAGPMAGSCMLGGYAGTHLANRLPQHWLRRVILTIAILLTVAYFWKVYFAPQHSYPTPKEAPHVHAGLRLQIDVVLLSARAQLANEIEMQLEIVFDASKRF